MGVFSLCKYTIVGVYVCEKPFLNKVFYALLIKQKNVLYLIRKKNRIYFFKKMNFVKKKIIPLQTQKYR